MEETMSMKKFTIITVLFSCIFLVGCGLKTPGKRETVLDRNFGKSFETAKENQILDANAKNNLQPVFGLDGKSSENTMDAYRKTFATEQPNQTGNINLNLNRPKSK
jgi:hypothetical protein